MSMSNQGSLFGRYREIIIAVGFFLVFDLGVLVLNFYTSFRISEDAAAINIAGRQRMLSQRIAKLSYALDAPNAAGNAADIAELSSASALFDRSFKAFQAGGNVPGGDGQGVQLASVVSELGIKALTDAEPGWTKLRGATEAVINGARGADEFRALAVIARDNNLGLLASMNDLTTALEADAAERAGFLRWVQTIGIVLALLNFAYILFKFLRRLRSTDAAIEQVSAENAQILSSVREGLFLINADRTMGTQVSKSVSGLFSTEVVPGQDFFELLEAMVEPVALQEAKDYVDLLFSPHIKERLVQGINPLASLSVSSVNRLGQRVTSQLSFAFTRVLAAGVVTQLLVTVQDVSERVVLQGQLLAERQRAQREFSMLLTAVKSDPVQLAQFTSRGTALLGEVNDCLKKIGDGGSAGRTTELLTQAHRSMHRFKGDASTLGLELLATLAHQLESQLRDIERTPARSGAGIGPNEAAMVGLPLLLDDLMSKLDVVRTLAKPAPVIASDPARAQDASSATSPVDALSADLLRETTAYQTLVSRVAKDSGKSVHLSVDMPAFSHLNADQQRVVHDVTVQLLRNAVVHGIEDPTTRRASAKAAQGHVSVSLVANGGRLTLAVKDDGAGLVQARLRARLATLNWFDAQQLAAMTDQEVLGQLFRPGFSTASETVAEGLHAGRGVGLDVVKSLAKSIGATVGISQSPARYAEFRLSFGST